MTTESDADEIKTEPKRYRKKPVVIIAYQTPTALDITTLEGVVHASPGDFVITGIAGEKYPCKPNIFYATYEEAGQSMPFESARREGIVQALEWAFANIMETASKSDDVSIGHETAIGEACGVLRIAIARVRVGGEL